MFFGKIKKITFFIRRTNLHDGINAREETPNSYYLNVIERIKNENLNKELLFHIYSQGDITNFSCFTPLHI